VFFRAGDWTTAMGMLQGMVGLNGVALPQGVGIRLGAWQEILSGWGVTFYLGGGENFMMTWLWIAALGATALLLPNTQQWMADFRPGFTVHESRESDEIRGWLRAPEQLAWRPGRRFAMLSALVACAGILSLAHVSEFLYFQF
jgi:alginate O-acetyltransferase complex protein AlgI